MEWSISPDVIVKILISIFLGGAIGLEREMHGRSAGLRTHILVCMGALLVMIVGRYIASVSNNDPGRIAAGVITGVGFLGAGVIIRMEHGVRGLTTAASLWLVAALGITVAMDLYGIAVAGAVLTILILFGLSRLERVLPEVRRRQVDVIFEGKPVAGNEISSILKSFGCRIVGNSMEYDIDTDSSKVEYSVRLRGYDDPTPLVEKIISLKNVKKVIWH